MDAQKLSLNAAEIDAVPLKIPGATGEFRVQILNENQDAGVVTTIIHLPEGGVIPAHSHKAGAEMHYVLEGELIEAGQSFGPGSFLTFAPGIVHGPHESKVATKVLTVQQWQSKGGSFDFEPAEGAEQATDATPAQDSAAGEQQGGAQQAETKQGEGQSAASNEAGDRERFEGKGYS